MHHYQELCGALDMPVMANEMLMHDIGTSTQWLMHGATDLLRANARHGTTLVLKMAHFARSFAGRAPLPEGRPRSGGRQEACTRSSERRTRGTHA